MGKKSGEKLLTQSSLLSSDVHPTDFVIKVLLQICLVVVDQKVNHSNVSAPSTFCAFQPVKALRIAKPFVVCCWFALHNTDDTQTQSFTQCAVCGVLEQSL